MSANPQNTNLVFPIAEPGKTERRRNASSGREALQALLAFSSLQEQIRRRREIEIENGRRLSPEDAWQLEQFVLDEVLHLVAERAQAITGADGIAIALADGDGVICRASVGLIVPDPGVRLNPNSGFSGTCFRTGEIIRCDDTETDPRVNVETSRKLGAKSLVAVPLLGQKSVLGLLEAFSTEAYAFNDSDVRSLSLLAELMLAAMKPEEENRMAEISRQISAESSKAIEAEKPELKSEPPVVAFGVRTTGEAVPHESSTWEKGFQVEVPKARPAVEAHKMDAPSFSIPQSSARRDWLVIAALVLVAVAAGGGTFWMVKHHLSASPVSATTLNSATVDETSAVDSPSSLQSSSLPSANPDSTSQASSAPAVSPKATAGPTEVMDVRHWTSGNVTTVAIDLQDAVQYEAHRLNGPDRIYFDLFDTSLAPAWFGKSIGVTGSQLERIRIAQTRKGVTRVVLETKGQSSYTVSLQPNPYRLIVQIGQEKPGASPTSDLDFPSTALPAQKSGAKGVQARAVVPSLTIVLDPGHGGWDVGSVGQGGLLEKDLALDIVKRLGKLIESRLHATVVYTRQDDTYVSLERRAELANFDHASLFLSVHANYSSSPAARGVETYYSNSYSSVHSRTPDTDTAFPQLKPVDWAHVDIREKALGSQHLARDIQEALYGSLATRNADLPDRGVKEASYAVLVGTTMPAVLAEVSFVSSPSDEMNLQKEAYRQKIAEALYAGVATYVKHARYGKITAISSLSASH